MATLAALLANIALLAGGLTQNYFAETLESSPVIVVFLALSAGSFLFLAVHSIHWEWAQSGLAQAAKSALAGVAGSVALEELARIAFR